MAGALELARGRGLLAEEAVSSGRMFDQKGAGRHGGDWYGRGSCHFESLSVLCLWFGRV